MAELVLLTGATGYVGGRLLQELERSGVPLRCLARRPEVLTTRVADTTEVVRGDVLDAESLREPMQGVETAYYMIHSMGDEGDFEALEREAATNFGNAAREAGVKRIIYLGGLGSGDDLSAHLSSRQVVGRILRDSGVPTIELRASIIIGSGSLSFEMIRSLVEKLPVMITPSWVRVEAQLIAIEDVVAYLDAARTTPIEGSRIFEIGGADVVSYGEIMQEYARARGLKRWMIPVPMLTPWLSSLWLGLVTPLYAKVGRKLIEGVKNPTVVTDPSARELGVEPRGIADAIARALANEQNAFATSRWSDAGTSGGPSSGAGGDTGRGDSAGGTKYGRRIVDTKTRDVPCSSAEAFAPIRRIGGDVGWYYGNPLWRIRGFLDRLVGGPGLRRGRRDPEDLRPGEALDFWRVEAFEPDRLLRLRAEMRLPGRAWLQYEVAPDGESGQRSVITQSAIFDPLGLFGRLYWYALLPIHAFMFRGMLRNVAREAERMAKPPSRGDSTLHRSQVPVKPVEGLANQ
ncbi:MAG: SDR family oxidoreductase [marine benthic group bacterium]|nr:SDR family oxidoreductase [Gemmatimonadota bacterium]